TMRSPSFLLLLPLCFASLRVKRQSTAAEVASSFLQPQSAALAAESLQVPPGPILETGRFNVVSSKLLRGAEMPDIRRAPTTSQLNSPSSYNESPLREQPQQLPHSQQQPIYRYDGPLDGRKVWIYKKILRPVRITSHGMERLPGAQVVEQWAEGGFGNQLSSPLKAPIYAPTNNGFFTGQ
ncbi:hypothetical protein PMAYCL1PPCAC_18760, partial [Pristionchus mayeri]